MIPAIQHPALESEEAAQKLVDEWTVKLSAISRNLMDLQESEAAKNAKMRVRFNEPYTGATAPMAKEALEDLEGLWRNYLILSHAHEEAVAICTKRGFFVPSKIEAAKKLLLPSVELPTVYVPVSKRSLLSGAERIDLACPSDVLEAMLKSFDKARDSLEAIERAEKELLTSVEQARKESGALREWAKALGATNMDNDRLTALANDLSNDPIGASAKLSLARVEIEKERARLMAVDKLAKEVDRGFQEARKNVAAFRDLGDRSRLAIEETKAKIQGPWSFQVPEGPEAASALEEWLASIEQARAAGKIQAASVGLKKWEANCATRAAQAESIYANNRKLLDEREELKGRFRALQVKAKALAARGINPSAWSGVQQQAEDILWVKPMDMAGARKFVSAFESSLSAAARS